jgi:hypothetical protein
VYCYLRMSIQLTNKNDKSSLKYVYYIFDIECVRHVAVDSGVIIAVQNCSYYFHVEDSLDL